MAAAVVNCRGPLVPPAGCFQVHGLGQSWANVEVTRSDQQVTSFCRDPQVLEVGLCALTCHCRGLACVSLRTFLRDMDRGWGKGGHDTTRWKPTQPRAPTRLHCTKWQPRDDCGSQRPRMRRPRCACKPLGGGLRTSCSLPQGATVHASLSRANRCISGA